MAYEALKNNNPTQAKEAIKGSLKNSIKETASYRYAPIMDYVLWINASASVQLGTEAFRSGKFQEAINHCREAISFFLQIEESHPYSPHLKKLQNDIGRTELLLGNGFAEQKKWEQAIIYFHQAFQRLLTAHALGQNLQPSHLERYLKSCKSLKEENGFCESWLKKFASFYSPASAEAKMLRSRVPEVFASLPLKGSRDFTRQTQTYKAPDQDLTAFDSAMKLFFTGKYAESAAQYRRFLDEFPRSSYRFRARYWLAQSVDHQDQHSAALKLYEDLEKDSPLSYYGFLSSVMTGQELSSSLDALLPQAQKSDSSLSPQEVLRLHRAEVFLRVHAHELAALELKDLTPRDAISSAFLVYLVMLNNEALNYSNVFSILNELIQRKYDRMYSSFTLRMIFPMPFLELVKKYATEIHVDPILVLSLIKQESAFDPMAGSGAGAVGLMQLMPATAAETDSEVLRSDLTKAETNIRVGVLYLKELIDQYHGNIALALAGYNAGPAAVERWTRESPFKQGMLTFIESIPYRETREYVSSIIRNYFWYTKKLGEPKSDNPTKILEYFWTGHGH